MRGEPTGMTLEMSAFKKDQRVPGSEEVGSLLDGETEAERG